MNPLVLEIIKTSCCYFKENNLKVSKCWDTLEEDALWQRPTEGSNARGKQELHSSGNSHQEVNK